MSGTNFLIAPPNGGNRDDDGGMNMLAGTARQPSIAAPMPGRLPPLGQQQRVQAQHVAQALAGHTQDEVIQKRDNAGKEMEYLQEVMQNPNITRPEVAAYLGSLESAGQMSPEELVGMLRSLPQQSQQIRQWAQTMFTVMAHVGVHGHAAYPRELFPGQQQSAPQDGAPDQGQGNGGDDDSE